MNKDKEIKFDFLKDILNYYFKSTPVELLGVKSELMIFADKFTYNVAEVTPDGRNNVQVE